MANILPESPTCWGGVLSGGRLPDHLRRRGDETMNRRSLRSTVLAVVVAGLLLVAVAASAEWLATGTGEGNGAAGTWPTTTTAPPGPEVCDGVDNDHNGEVDDGLAYCFGGVPAPNTDGAVCLAGFLDEDGDAVNGCEVTETTDAP